MDVKTLPTKVRASSQPADLRSLPTAQPLVEVRDVTVRYGGRAVLEHVDLAVRSGEIVTLIGPNGSGKTTLIRVLGGLMQPDSGSVHRRNGLRIGYVPQKADIRSSLPLTVSRFLMLGSRATRRAIGDTLEEVGAGGLAGASIHGLSGGEFQRVALARALLRHPDLLLLDEPAQGVDLAGQVQLYELIDRLRRERGLGVVLSSHDLHLVMAATDRVVCLNGHVCCVGSPSSVASDPAFRRLFGEAAAALAVYRHDPTHDHAHDHGNHHCHEHEPGQNGQDHPHG
jgi:zinc transport system ATP-binding protein